jgi:hypothetical protein
MRVEETREKGKKNRMQIINKHENMFCVVLKTSNPLGSHSIYGMKKFRDV